MLDTGCSVQGEQGDIPKEHPVLKSEKEVLEKVKLEQYQQIASARDLTDEEFSSLKEAHDTPPSERYAMGKYRLMAVYNICDTTVVTAQWVADYVQQE
ncbi:hypothetical protein BGZ79_007545 [Entomortierella chlamydospora]|nr:hypothetical protein BGZ79_007545 [Entomortierella chlamydospora]